PCHQQQREYRGFHANTVPQQYLLTSINYWGTVIAIGDRPMANILNADKQTAIIGALAEGSSIAQSIGRPTCIGIR
ncbi:MAG TPA: hypothetical protein VNM68_06010, partial [Candidatus Polarisedimenticolia bacterium]|nr:hypothetical protein [Candidatus Polarisedimenticolia bacterium]